MPDDSDHNSPHPGNTPIPSSVMDEADLQYRRSQDRPQSNNSDAESAAMDHFHNNSINIAPQRPKKRARIESSPDSTSTLKPDPDLELKPEPQPAEPCKASEVLGPELNRLKGRVLKLSRKVEANQGAQRRYAAGLCEDFKDALNEQLEVMAARLSEVEASQPRFPKAMRFNARLKELEKSHAELKKPLKESVAEQDESEEDAEEDKHEIFIAYEYKPEIERINAAIEGVKTEAMAHSEQFTEIGADIEVIEEFQDITRDRIDDLKAEVKTLRYANGQLQFEVEEFGSECRQLKAEMEDLKRTLRAWAGHNVQGY